MGKKRKSTGSGPNNASRQHAETEREEQTQYGINEDFADSEDEFFVQRDHIRLDHGPAGKRRKVDKDSQRSHCPVACV